MKVLLFVYLIVPLCLGWGETDHGLVVELVPTIHLKADQNQPNSPAIFKFKIQNPTDRPITILKWGTPLEDELVGSIFDVTNTNTGEKARYTGIYGRRQIISNLGSYQQQFQTLSPGEAVSLQLDISNYYDFSSRGVYEISLNTQATFFTGSFADMQEIGLFSVPSSQLGSYFSIAPLTSESIYMHVSVAPKNETHNSRSRKNLGIYYTGCTRDKIDRLPALVNIAQKQVDNVWTYLSLQRCNTNYVTWFGQYTASRWKHVKDVFGRIKMHLDLQRYNFVCEPYNEHWCSSRYLAAWIWPDPQQNPNWEMHLCDEGYWNSDEEFRGATIYHELSHHDDIGATRDYCYFESCKQLAINQPDTAIQTAGCYDAFGKEYPRC